MNSKELIQNLNILSKSDLSNEFNQIDFFNLLKELSIRVVSMKNPMSIEFHEELAIMLAEELYINHSKGLINNFTPSIYNYADRVLLSVVSDWYKLNKKLPKELRAPIKYHPDQFGRYSAFQLDESLYYSETPQELRELFSRTFKALVHVGRLFEKVGNKNIRTLNMRMSLVLSIRCRRFVRFRLSEAENNLCRFCYNLFKQDFSKILSEKEEAYKISEGAYALSCYLDMMMFDPEED